MHDFAWLRFDPSLVQNHKLVQLPLRPDRAKVGLDIRVIGNDSCERLNILDGTLSRLDKNPPDYNEGYRDFNTLYYQASTSTAGGSSGSPVIDIDGNVVALMAGARLDTSSTYFLPLNRAIRALTCLKTGAPVTRGDVGCWFTLRPYHECQKLGLTKQDGDEREKASLAMVDLPVAKRVIHNGPSYGKIEEGDIILEIGGQLVRDLDTFDEVFDEHIGETMKMRVRRGSKSITVEIKVQNLHEITPDRFVSACGTNFNTLSYIQALRYGRPCGGVYVNVNNGSFITCGDSLIETIDRRPITNLEHLIEVMESLPDKAKVRVTYRCFEMFHFIRQTIVWIDRHFFPKIHLVVRDDINGKWNWEPISQPLPPTLVKPQKGIFKQLVNVLPELDYLSSCFVHVECRYSGIVDGIPNLIRDGMGVVIDKQRGLVHVSRSIVTSYFCNIAITIANTIVVEGKVATLHTEHGHAVIQYDPGLVLAEVCPAKLDPENLKQNEDVYLIGFPTSDRLVYDKTTVADISPLILSMDSALPRYRASNVDVVTIATPLGNECFSGVLADSKGNVRAFWMSHYAYNPSGRLSHKTFGLPVSNVSPILSQLQSGIKPMIQILPAEFEHCLLTDACLAGMSEESALAIAEKSDHEPRALRVLWQTIWRREETDSLQGGDVLVSLDGEVICGMSGLQVVRCKKTVKAEVIRDGNYVNLDIATIASSALETEELIYFGGMIIQTPHHTIRRSTIDLPSEVYIGAQQLGSPADEAYVQDDIFITEVDYQPTPDIDTFFKAVKSIADNTSE